MNMSLSSKGTRGTCMQLLSIFLNYDITVSHNSENLRIVVSEDYSVDFEDFVELVFAKETFSKNKKVKNHFITLQYSRVTFHQSIA